MEIKKILWPTDLSRRAAQALPYVTSLSERYQAEIHLLYVMEELGQFGAWYGDFDRSHIQKMHEMERQMAEERLANICEEELQGCPLYIRHIAMGDPSSEILKLINSEKVDVVVIASQGRKGHFGFGSVAEKVVKPSAVPVLTVPIRVD